MGESKPTRTTNWANYQREIYAQFHPPAFSTDVKKWEADAKAKVPTPNFNYVYGCANQSSTYNENLQAFERYRLVPNMLRDCNQRDAGIELWGKRYESPIFLAPVGVQGIMHKDGEEGVARAAAKTKTPYVFSSASTRCIEQVVEANGGPNHQIWYQLYWPGSNDITLSLLSRARNLGVKVLVVTLDTFLLGWRPKDLDQAYLPFLWGQGVQNGFADPVFNAKYDAGAYNKGGNSGPNLWNLLTNSPYNFFRLMFNSSTVKKSTAWMGEEFNGYKSWEDVKFLRDNWEGKLVLKGIQSVADARRCMEYKVDGIVVSNHGGRQADGAIASLDALARIGADEVVKESGMEIFFDSGIRTGSDVIKAKKLGAKAVLLGRPYVYGLGMGGEAGVEHVIRCMNGDMETTMAQVGIKSWDELDQVEMIDVADRSSKC